MDETNEVNKEVLVDITNIKSTETYTLPSKGLVYNPEENIPASITLRRMTTKEDKMRLRNMSQDKIRRDILQSCVLDKDVDVGELKLMDVNYLLFKLRTISLLDDTYKVNCFCNNCATQFIHEIKLSEIPVKYFSKKDLSKLKVQLPISHQKIDFKYPKLNDLINMGDKLRDYFDRFPDADRGETYYTITTMLYIDKVNGTKMISEELEDWLDNLDLLDSRAIRDITLQLEGLFGFDDNLEAECPKCKSIVKHGLPITEELFTPSK